METGSCRHRSLCRLATLLLLLQRIPSCALPFLSMHRMAGSYQPFRDIVALTERTGSQPLTTRWLVQSGWRQVPSLVSRCWTLMLPNRVIAGNTGPSCRAGVLLGEDDMSLPNMLTETMKWRAGSIARPLLKNLHCVYVCRFKSGQQNNVIFIGV